MPWVITLSVLLSITACFGLVVLWCSPWSAGCCRRRTRVADEEEQAEGAPLRNVPATEFELSDSRPSSPTLADNPKQVLFKLDDHSNGSFSSRGSGETVRPPDKL
ncbi:hypothetical protein DACRYDRAFT_24574 [Dacryopinax primogenitus]|uniref:Secreted protein n=1 Tax=Dacryopinax primogenitus (strain DJM 731) TaxID=1858805 RepID=M5FS86_DACPD|nr:uncharacterized protein DACRYDRAFT_24574 [Dacryopinax primogenitus]EJT98024.1 hypothetical protein DACRYDRAFT_24574 [Dacryopinax primogenitus]